MKMSLQDELNSLVKEQIDECLEIVDVVGTRYFRESFHRKAFDGNPWLPIKNPQRRDSPLIDTAHLYRSFLSERIPDGVRFSFGKAPVVGYAQVHNEGFDGDVVIPAHTRRTKRGVQQVRQHTRHQHIPQRQFLGAARELEEELHAELSEYIANELNRR